MREIFSTFRRENSGGLSKLCSRDRRNIFRESKIFNKFWKVLIYNLFLLPDIQRNNLAFGHLIIGRSVETAFYLPRWKYWGKNYLWTFLAVFAEGAIKFQSFVKNVSAELSTLHFTCPKVTVGPKRIFLKKKYQKSYSDIDQCFFGLWGSIFGRVVKNALILYGATFWEKTIFLPKKTSIVFFYVFVLRPQSL